MYSESAIITLGQSIGFGALSTSPGFTLSTNIVGATNGIKFKTYHQLVTPDNLYKCVDEPMLSKTKFEAQLDELRINGARMALTKVLEQNKAYDDNFDYDATISAKTALLAEVVGYQVAISSLELMMSTKRTNLESINADLTEAKLNLELNGYKTEKGVVVAVGLHGKLNDAIKKAQAVIFKNKVTINTTRQW